jgi:hypothetical protein
MVGLVKAGRTPEEPENETKRAFWKCSAKGIESEDAALARALAAIYCSLSAKNSRCCGLRVTEFARSRDSYNARLRPSRENCAGTQRPVVVRNVLGHRRPVEG